MNNRLLKVTVILSVFALAGMAFVGTAAAQPANAQANEDPVVRADDPGTFVQFEFDESDDSTTTTFTVNVSDLVDAGVDNLDNAKVAANAGGGDSVTGVTRNDNDGDAVREEIVIDTDGAGGGSSSTITVEIGTTAGTTAGSAASPTGTVAASNADALQTATVNPGVSYTVDIEDGSSNTDSFTSTIEAGNINFGSVAQTGSINLGQDTTVQVTGLTYDDGASVVNGNVEGTIIIEQPELGNRSALLDGTNSNSSIENYIDGDHNLYVNQGDLSDGTAATNGNSISNPNAYNVDGLRAELETPEGEVSGEDTVLYNSQQTVSGTIYRTSANAPSQVVADDRVVNYEFVDPAASTVTSGDTNNGEFSVSESWDYTVTNGGYERLDGQQYTVNVGDGANPTAGNQGSDTFTTLLDISFNIDGTSIDSAQVTYEDTVQVSGTVLDGQGNPVSGYRVATAMYDDGNSVAKTGSTTTGNNGEYNFTFRYNDGLQDPAITTITGDDTGGLGVHLGTQQDAQGNVDFAGGTNNGVTRYGTLELQPQDAQVDITADGNSPVNFEDTYRIKVTDENDNVLTNQRVLVEGAFEGDAPLTIDTGSLNPGAGDQVATEDVTGDSNPNDVVAFIASTDSNGWMNFTATPVQSQFTVNVTAEETGDISTAQTSQITIPAGNQDGLATVYTQPDAKADGESFAIGAADPVNIIDEAVDDPQTDYDGTDPTNAPSENSDFQDILQDNGPEVVEVLPLTDSTSNRISSGDRLGFDTNFDLDGITAYRVEFELRDQSNNLILPNGAGGNDDFDRMKITGAGINATIVGTGGALSVNGDGVLSAQYVDIPSDSDGNEEYAFFIRPTEVEAENPTIDHEIDVDGQDNVTFSLDTDGLEIAEFQVDGNTTDTVQPNSVVDVTSVVEDATEGGVPINNGRVRLSQNGTELTDFDARTSNTNDGEYTFQGVSVGPRGFDTDADGIGEQISTLDFTAYQYNDSNADQALDQREVNKGAVEQLGIALDDTLQVEYDAENTSKYSGVDAGNFTLTRGVEYNQIAFELTEQDGTPVDLTEGLGGNTVGLNSIAQAATGNDPELVTLTTPASGEASVNFDTAASNPSNGYYVISDIQEVGNIDTTAAAYNDGDSFVFGSPSVDAGLLPYTLNIETPDRSQATNASETGTFVTDDADVDGEVAGVAGDSVPNSVSDTDNDGDIIDEVNNDQSDWTQDFNTDTSNIDTPTANVDRLYRINATVTDALGTPLNNSDYSDIRVDFDGSVDPTSGGNPTGDNAKFEMVNGPDVAPMTDDGILALGDGNSAGLSSSSTNDEVAINNEDGTFQYDIEVESAGDDGVYTPVFETEAQANVGADPAGKSDASQSPTIRNPVVNVFGENGGELPVSETSDNQILANDLPNQLRVEAFPADADGFVLPSGIQYSLAGSFAENQVSTSTQNVNNVQTAQLATEGFDEGQIGFFQATPTGTGVGFASLRQGSAVGPIVRDQDGNRTLFDVLSTNRGLDLDLTPSNPTAQDDITVTATDDSTGNVVDNVSITVESPTDNTTTILTDEDGEAIIPSSFTDESGTYSIETRRAGYADSTASFDVAGVPDPAEFEVSNVQPDGATVDEGADITVTADIENVGDQTGTQDVEFRLNATGEPLDGDAVVDNKTVNLDGGNTTTVSFDVTAPANNGTYDHGVFTNGDSATATLTVENQTDQTLPSPIQDVSDELWTEVTGDGNLELGDLGTAIQEYQDNGEINGVTIELGDLGSLINYYQNNN